MALTGQLLQRTYRLGRLALNKAGGGEKGYGVGFDQYQPGVRADISAALFDI